MVETPADLDARYPDGSLRRFRYHTGAPLRPLAQDEPCPVLFRDLGLDGMALYLDDKLTRLAGPLSPITYLRTADYAEPYADHGAIGRLVFLRPLLLAPWHSGVPHIYVADARRCCDPASFGFVPGGQPSPAVEAALRDVRDTRELREALGGREYDDAVIDTRERVGALGASLAAAEVNAEPLRRCLQGADPALRDQARAFMAKEGLGEHDLCAAWHHLSPERRAAVTAAVAGMDPTMLAAARGLTCRLRL